MKKIITICLIFTFTFSFTLDVFAQTDLSNVNKNVVNKYQNAKGSYLKHVNSYKNARSNFLVAKTKFRAAKKIGCTEEILQKSKDFLEKTADVMTNYLNAVKTKAENAPFLTEEQRASIIAEMDSDISWITAKKAEIQNAENCQQLIEHAKVVRNQWLEIRGHAKKVTGLMLSYNINRAIKKANNIAQRLESKINELKDAGYETEELENLLEDYNEKIELAESKYELAKEQYEQISNVGDADELFRAGHKFILEADKYLRQAYKDLKEIVKEIKQIKKDQENLEEENQDDK